MKNFFKNKQLPKVKVKEPRDAETINKEYVHNCALLGQMQFKLDEQVRAVEEQSAFLSRLNNEGLERQKLNATLQEEKGAEINGIKNQGS